MAKRVQIVGHASGAAQVFLGRAREITVDQGNNSIRVHDAINAGGTELARADLNNVLTASASNHGKMSAQQAADLVAVIAGLAAEIINRIADVDAEEMRAIAAEDTKVSDTGDTITGLLVLEAALNLAKGADIASATTTDIGAATGNLVDITGSVTIVSFGTVAAGVQRKLRFTGAPLLTYNATSVILPGVANIQTVAGSTIVATSLGSGNWLFTDYNTSNNISGLADASVVTAKINDSAVVTAKINNGAVTYAKTAFSNNITQGDLAANSVGQSEVKTTYQQVSAVAPPPVADFTFSGGVYSLGHTFTTASTVNNLELHRVVANGTVSNIARWRLSLIAAGGSASVRLYYINSSPPYDLGDGDIPLFIYVEIDPSGNIISMSISPEAPWHYNGPTDITPSSYIKRNGILVPQIKRKDMSGIPMSYKAAEAAGIAAMNEYSRAFAEAPEIEFELTQAIKNADMDIVPLALNNQQDRPLNTTVLLDPVSDLTWEIFNMRQHGEFDAIEFITNWCNIGNTALARNGPAAVDIVSFSKRNTRRN